MRPETLKKKLNKAIKYWINTGDNKKFLPIMPSMIRRHKIWSRQEEDFRSGAETYGYDDAESIHNHMEYISDRWRCAFRLKWIIDGIENGSI